MYAIIKLVIKQTGIKHMKLEKFLETLGKKESDIIEYKGKEALEAVKQNGYALQYVKEQTESICLEAVKEDGDALQYVNKSIFEQTITVCPYCGNNY